MCACNPSIRTPFCGKPGCARPRPQTAHEANVAALRKGPWPVPYAHPVQVRLTIDDSLWKRIVRYAEILECEPLEFCLEAIRHRVIQAQHVEHQTLKDRFKREGL